MEIIKLENTGDKTQTYYPIVYSFVPKGEKGAEEFILPEKSDETYSLAKWINISKKGITLEPKGKIAVNFSVSVPENAEAGGYYAGILFSTQPNNLLETSNIQIASQIGPIILGQIAGETTEQGSIIEFSVDKGLYNYPPVNFVTRFRNTGEIHLKPTGKIEIYDIFGRKLDELIVNENLGNVLPQSIRKFDNEWFLNEFIIGKFTANVILEYGKSNNYVTESISFWILPWKEILIGLLLTIVSLTLLIILIKKYNAHIAKKAIEKHIKEENNKNSK